MQKYPFLFIGSKGADQKFEAYLSGPRIVGGRNAFPEELPFQVSHVSSRFLVSKCCYSVKVDKKRNYNL
jgi:hypothetical protein